MKEEQNNEKSCLNCRHFSQHYSKQGIKFNIVYCGHCLKQVDKKKKNLKICALWENGKIKKEERKTAIKETIERMFEKLNEIAILLEDDKIN